MEVKRKMDFLCRQPAFAGLSFMEMREIEHMLLPVAFTAGDELFVQGQKADKTYFILEGSVQVCRDVDNSVLGFSEMFKRARIGFLGPFDFVGEVGCMTVRDGVYEITAVAWTPVTAYTMHKFDLLNYLVRARQQFMLYSILTCMVRRPTWRMRPLSR